FVLATPVHPNYRLGALVGSPCDTLTVNATEAPKPLNGLRIYPNPAQDRAVLELTETWPSNVAAQYRIYNALGALAQSGAIAEGAKKIVVSLAGLPNGLYVCQVLRDGEVLGAAKLTIVR
ncbi:MAG: T9SS type A sorting domain-containing protein, partial [Saprospiraceae bacterium]